VERHHEIGNVITATVMRQILTKLTRNASGPVVSNGSKAEILVITKVVRYSAEIGHLRSVYEYTP
jgi:hypothetical protein